MSSHNTNTIHILLAFERNDPSEKQNSKNKYHNTKTHNYMHIVKNKHIIEFINQSNKTKHTIHIPQSSNQPIHSQF